MWIYFVSLMCMTMTILDITTGLTTTPSQECPSGNFGENCSYSCGDCRDNLPCDVITGVCPNGCSAGWQGQRCLHPCPSGKFGENCSYSCGHCRDDLPCDVITGVCPNGCSAGWQGQHCLLHCANGYYGDECLQRCGFCQGPCNSITGSCPEGCQEGWLGQYCLQSLPFPEIKNLLLHALTIVGVVVFVIVIFSIGLCVYHCWIADRKKPDNKSSPDSDSVHSGHTVSATAVMMRNMAHSSRALSQLYSVFSWGSDFDPGPSRGQQAARPEPNAMYANGQVTLGYRLSQEVPPPPIASQDPLYQNSDLVQGKYENWIS